MTTYSAPTASTLTVAMPSDREIRIERTFNAHRGRVWRAMTDPAMLLQWYGRGDKLVERVEVERVGIGDSSNTPPMAPTA